MSFLDTLLAASRRNNSLLCVGLDPEPTRIPPHLRNTSDPVLAFCAAIVEATADLVCAFKPNSAFFEALGASGVETLRKLCAMRPGVPFILDAKRGDIGSTSAAYASAAFDYIGADAITLNPYLGGDALEPFLHRADRGCFILCRTSNPGGADLQSLPLADGRPLFIEVARKARDNWNTAGNVGLVVGATFPAEARSVRELCPELPLLVPGIGAQGGDLAAAVAAAVDQAGERALINVSRGIMYAGGGEGFAEAARSEAARLRAAINTARQMR